MTSIELGEEAIYKKSFLQGLLANPEHVRKLLLDDPDLLATVTAVLKWIADNYALKNDHLPDFFRKYLPSNPSATVLHLASGDGSELLYSRQVFPKGRIIGNDFKVTAISVATEFTAGAEFLHEDLSKTTPEGIVETIGTVPDIVICRHPLIAGAEWWPDVLAEWGKIVQSKGNTLIITNYGFDEQEEVLNGLEKSGIYPEIYTPVRSAFPFDLTLQNSTRMTDSFVTVVR